MINDSAQQQQGIVNVIKSSIEPSSLIKKISDSKDFLIEIGIFTIFGFLIGFLFKRYNRYFMALLFFTLILFLLHKYGIITFIFNQPKLNELLGMRLPNLDSTIGIELWEWIKSHVIIAVGFLIGFLCGMRLG